MFRGFTALVGLATTVWVGVFGVEAILAVTAATITSLFFCPPPVSSDLIQLFVCLFVATLWPGTCVWFTGGRLQLLKGPSCVQTVFNAGEDNFLIVFVER